MKLKKKGFTIVELVIVIAVIAILAAVLIPTFANLINKANIAADTAVVKNLNTVLIANGTTDGKNVTMTEALKDAENAGYTVEKLTPMSTGDILWDEENDQFVLIDSDHTVYSAKDVTDKKYKLWKIVDEIPTAEADKGYSYYLSDDFTGTDVTVSAGLDVGNHSDIATVTYTNETEAKEVSIRTNSAKTILIINGFVNSSDSFKGDVIYHYGISGNVDINKCAYGCFYERSTEIGNLTSATGKIVIENNTVINGDIIGNGDSVTEISVDANLNGTVYANDNAEIISNDILPVFTSSDNAKASGKAILVKEESSEKVSESIKNKDYAFIKLSKNISVSAPIEIAEGKEVLLDLNGFMISADLEQEGKHYYAIKNYGILTIKDSSESKTGKISARGTMNLGNGIMYVNDGTFEAIDGNGGAAVWNEATLYVNGGAFKNLVEGSASDYVGAGCLNNSGTTVITKGCFEGLSARTYAILSTGNIKICPLIHEDVIVFGNHGGLGIDAGVAEIYGGTYNSRDYYGLYVSNDASGEGPQKANVSIYGGIFDGKEKSVWIGSDGNSNVDSFIVIYDGEYKKPMEIQDNVSSRGIIVCGGKFVEDPSKYIDTINYTAIENNGIWTVAKKS